VSDDLDDIRARANQAEAMGTPPARLAVDVLTLLARIDTLDEESATYMNQSDTWQERARAAAARIDTLTAERDQAQKSREKLRESLVSRTAYLESAEARLAEVEAERDAYKKAKAENDERFQLKAQAAEARLAVLTKALELTRGFAREAADRWPNMGNFAVIEQIAREALADGAEQ
jgi:chromosome segregation ATPase